MGKLGQETTLEEDATIDTNIDSPYNIYVRPGLMPDQLTALVCPHKQRSSQMTQNIITL